MDDPRVIRLDNCTLPETDNRNLEFEAFVRRQDTLEQMWDLCERADWMLFVLRSAYSDRLIARDDGGECLRRFAVWCAQKAYEVVAPRCRKDTVLEAVESYLDGKTTFGSVLAVREQRKGGAAGAGTVGMSHHIPGAGAQLAAFHCADEDPLDASRWASRFYLIAVLDLVLLNSAHDPDRDLLWYMKTKVSEQERAYVSGECLRSQADALRSYMNNPFRGNAAIHIRCPFVRGVMMVDIAAIPGETLTIRDIPLSTHEVSLLGDTPFEVYRMASRITPHFQLVTEMLGSVRALEELQSERLLVMREGALTNEQRRSLQVAYEHAETLIRGGE